MERVWQNRVCAVIMDASSRDPTFLHGAFVQDQVTPGNSPSKGTPDPQQPLDLHTELGRAAPEQQQQQQYKVQPEFGKPSCEQWQQLNPLSKLSLVEQQQQQQPALGKQLEGNSFTGSTTLNLETALSLYGLTESQSFWEVQQDTRCLMGWGGNTVVVSFRGTASMKNALADLQVLSPDAELNV